jgi:uncharacterized membrane protein
VSTVRFGAGVERILRILWETFKKLLQDLVVVSCSLLVIGAVVVLGVTVGITNYTRPSSKSVMACKNFTGCAESK